MSKKDLFCEAMAKSDVILNQLKPDIAGQAFLESDRCSTKLAIDGNNFWGLKYQKDLNVPFPVGQILSERYLYCSFRTIEEAIAGYWAFVHRPPYPAVDQHLQDGRDYLSYIGPIFCPPSETDDWQIKHGGNYSNHIVDSFHAKAVAELKKYGWQEDIAPPLPLPIGGGHMIENHLLKGASFIQSPNHYNFLCKPRWLGIHCTSAPNYLSTYYTFIDPKSFAASQLVIDEDGSRYQFLPFNVPAYSLGRGCYWGGKENIEGSVLNVELVNMETVNKVLGKYGRWMGWSKKFAAVDAARIVQGTHRFETSQRYWVSFLEPQIQSLFEFAEMARDVYHLVDVRGHDDLQQIHRVDPGALFPMEKLRKEVFGVDDNTPRFVARKWGVTLKVFPSLTSPSVYGGWTEHLTTATILDRRQRWVKIRIIAGSQTAKVGWVMEKELDVGGETI